jgi:hypothetical protein
MLHESLQRRDMSSAQDRRRQQTTDQRRFAVVDELQMNRKSGCRPAALARATAMRQRRRRAC